MPDAAFHFNAKTVWPELSLWIGGYTAEMDGAAAGIGLIGAEPGRTPTYELAAAATSPSYLTRSGDLLYTVGESAATVSAYRINGSFLRHLATVEAAGASPCSLAVVGPFLVTASYGDGAVGVHRLSADGSPGPVAQTLVDSGAGPHAVQDGPHAHDVLLVDGSTVLTTDLGTDRVHIHRVTDAGLERTGSVQLPAGSGPRDLLLHNSGVVWVLGELGCDIFVLRRAGETFEVAGRTGLPGAAGTDHAAGLARNGDGSRLYVGLRGTNRVSWLVTSPDGLTMSAGGSVDCGGNWPRHVVVVDTTLLVANQLSSDISSFQLGHDGTPTLVKMIPAPSPTYLLPI
ncbi:MAG: hypothetical protein JWQ43_2451 [Glaciihabitans sp.]|nr:hypothetical protein [Glaciihabitans sp.]